MKNKLRKEFGIFKYGKLRKILGVRYKWKIFESGENFVVMSMDDKAGKIIKKYEKYTGKTLNDYPSPGAPGTTFTK